MDQLIQDSLNRISFKDRDSFHYHKAHTEETLEMVKWKEKEYLGLKMERFTMASIKTIESMELVNSQRMGRLIKEDGKMGRDKEKAFYQMIWVKE